MSPFFFASRARPSTPLQDGNPFAWEGFKTFRGIFGVAFSGVVRRDKVIDDHSSRHRTAAGKHMPENRADQNGRVELPWIPFL